ncbi:MAG: HNH endonuclease [Vicinamibacterales bacterium]
MPTNMRWGMVVVALLATVGCDRSPISPRELPSATPSAYVRADWQHWIDEDGDCQDTRQEVLIEESLVAPVLDSRGCRVILGMWRDEYTGATYTDPGDVDIDHRVALANAHRSGGWLWDASRKRAYANDLVDREHLVAVGASTNLSKGDRGPEAWRPPLRSSWCRYATSWRDIKRRWELSISVDEDRALHEMCS